MTHEAAGREITKKHKSEKSPTSPQVHVKQGGHTGVDNWPWPGGHSTWSSPTLFMVSY